MPSKLVQTISLLYRMHDADRQQLESELLKTRTRAYAQAMTDEARRHGCRNAVGNAPRREDLAELKRMSAEDAASIINTYNRELEAEVERLYVANVRGNRQYYFSNLERWSARRNEYKLRQISVVTETTSREFARSRFFDMNYDGSEQYVFSGPAAVCPDCLARFAAGVVDKAYTQRFPAPRHINCAHAWIIVRPKQMNCADIWLG